MRKDSGGFKFRLYGGKCVQVGKNKNSGEFLKTAFGFIGILHERKGAYHEIVAATFGMLQAVCVWKSKQIWCLFYKNKHGICFYLNY